MPPLTFEEHIEAAPLIVLVLALTEHIDELNANLVRSLVVTSAQRVQVGCFGRPFAPLLVTCL